MTAKQKLVIARIILAGGIFVTLMLLAAEGIAYIMWLFPIPYILIGYDVIIAAVKNLLKGRVFDEKLLMTIATAGAVILGHYAEAVAVMILYQTGELFMDLAVDNSKRSIARLMEIIPEFAVAVRNGEEVKVEPYEVEKGETIIVRVGERIPLDGIVSEGTSVLDTVALTGESLPREVTVGDSVASGCINLSGVLKLTVTSEYETSTVSKIMELVEKAAEKKAKSEKFITKFSRIYTPIVVFLAIAIAVIPSLLAGGWEQWTQRALIFLVVSCPCALVISIPLTFFSGIGGASRQGILIKGSNYIEQLARVKTVVFDKTGTLTIGGFDVIKIMPHNCGETEVLALAATAESYSNHPIARSICRRYDGRVEGIKNVKELSGEGIIADDIACGNALLMEELGIKMPEVEDTGSIIHVAKGKDYKGYILVADRVKEGALETVDTLEAMGIERIVMLTGDTTATAEAIGNELGIEERYSSLLPDGKVAKVEQFISEAQGSGSVCYIGDGINDAPVIAVSDVGIAMGAMGSDAAIEAADVVIMDGAPDKVIDAICISRFTMTIAKQNIVLSIAAKIIILLLSVLGITGMWWAVFADVGVALLATLNATRALRR